MKQSCSACLHADVFVLQGTPSFDKESMRVVITTAAVPQPPFRQKTPRRHTGGPDDLLCGPAPEVIRITVYFHRDAVDNQLLADIAGYDPGIITILLQIVIQPFRRSIRQVQGMGDIGIDHLLVRVQRKKILMKGPDMIPCLHG